MKNFWPILAIVLSTFLAVFLAAPGYACDFNVCKFEDTNGNGVQDEGEPNIPGWLIRITNTTTGTIVDTATWSDGCTGIVEFPSTGTFLVWEEGRECYAPTTATIYSDPPSLPNPLVVTPEPGDMGGYYVTVVGTSGSSHTVVFGNKPDCNGGGEGCTPGYWKNHLDMWAATGYWPGDDFDAIFGTDLFDPNITLEQAVNLGGGGVRKLARHGTAALLSAAHPDVDYPYSVAEVIAAVQAGDSDALAEANELGCPID